YVSEVLQLARLYDQNGTSAALSLDRLQQDLRAAEDDVVQANTQTLAALEGVKEASRQGGAALASAHERLTSAQATLTAARKHPPRARSAARPASFTPVAGALMGAASFSGGYVFPVGGGADTVSVSHFHHSYAAADIDAPQGSPVYALADAVVLA